MKVQLKYSLHIDSVSLVQLEEKRPNARFLLALTERLEHYRLLLTVSKNNVLRGANEALIVI